MGDLGLMLVNGTVIDDASLDDHTKVRVLSELITMTRLTIEGQALDIGWARDNRYDLTIDDYLVMATHKTAHYSGGVPLAIGAIVGKGTEKEIQGLRNFGLNTGLAFQIQDDLLNLIGKAESTKKGFRDDITEGKRTLMVVHALSELPPSKKQQLIDILSSHTTDQSQLNAAVSLMQEADSINFARRYAEQLTSKAKEEIADILEPSIHRDLLVSMADFFVNRLA